MVNVQGKAFLKKALKNQERLVKEAERKLKLEKQGLAFVKKQLKKAK